MHAFLLPALLIPMAAATHALSTLISSLSRRRHTKQPLPPNLLDEDHAWPGEIERMQSLASDLDPTEAHNLTPRPLIFAG